MKRVILILMGCGVLLVAWAAVFPGPMIHLVAGLTGGRTDLAVDPGRVSGNLVSGLVLTNPRVVTPAVRLSADRVAVGLDWSRLFNRVVAIRRLEIDAPVVVMTPGGPKKEKPEKDPEDKAPSRWRLEAPRIAVSDGVVLLDPEAKGGFQRVDGIEIHAGFSSDEIVVRRARAHVASSTVTLRGRGELAARYVDVHLQSEGPLEGRLDVRGSTANFMARGGGRWKDAYLRVRARGRWPEVAWTLDAQAAPLVFKGIRAGRARLTASGSHLSPALAKIEARAEDIRAGTTTIRSVAALVSGSTASHSVALDVRMPGRGLSLRGRGRLDGREWHAAWSAARASFAGDWRAERPFSTVIGPGLVKLRDVSLVSGGARISFDGALRGRTISSARFDVRNFDLKALSDAGLLKEPLAGRVTAKGRASGALENPSVSVNGAGRGLVFRGVAVASATVGGRFDGGIVHLDSLQLRPGQGSASISGSIPVRVPAKRRRIALNLRASGLDPAPFLVMADAETKNARLDADLRLVIHRGDFTATGPLRLSADRLSVPEKGIDLREIVVDARGDGGTLRIREGRARAGRKGKIALRGAASRDGFDIHLDADRFSFESPAGVSGTLNGAIALTGSPQAPRLTGDVKILSAVIEPSQGKKDRKKKRPAPETPKERRRSPPGPMAMKLSVRWDRDVWYRDGQTAVETKGALDIRKRPYQASRMFGAVDVIRGNYFLYGRRFEVEQGSVRFAGHPLADSILAVTALYTESVSKTKIWVDVTGSIATPRLALRSDPAMDEGNIISVLATGRPMEDIGASGGGGDRDAEAMAAKMIAGYFADRLRQGVQGRFDVDVLEFDFGDTGNPEITVGENVSKRLYVAYGQTLAAEGQRRLEAEYTLSRHWSLDGKTTTDGRYVIDLLFLFGFR